MLRCILRHRVLAYGALGLMGAAGLLSGGAAGQVIGVAADDTSNAAIVFDAELQMVLSMIPLSGSGLGDCVISPSHQLAFVSDFSGRVTVIDLAASPPRLADGVSRIAISNLGQDMALTPDERFLVVAGGGNPVPLCVIDVEQRRQVATFATGSDHNAIETAADGSILVTSRNANRIKRLALSETGVVTDTGQWMAFSRPNNVAAAPDGGYAMGVGRAGGKFGSFALEGMSPIDVRAEDRMGICGIFSPDGERFYARFTAPGTVAAYAFDASDGRLSGAPLFTFPVPDAPPQFGVDQMAVHPDGSLLYVSGPGGVQIHDAETGMMLSAIADAALGALTGIAIADLSPEPENQAPVIAFGPPVIVRDREHDLYDVSECVSIEDPDGDALSLTFTMFSNEPEAGRGDGTFRHAPDFKDELFDGGRGLLVRGERMGRGDGRYYLLVVTADDGRGGVAREACLTAVVPHDNGKRSVESIMAAAEEASAGLRAALASDSPIPLHLYEAGLSEQAGPKQ